MKDQVTRLGGYLATLFSSVADDVARDAEFVKRERGYSGAKFARVLVFGWIANKLATVEEFAEDLGVTPSAIQQRMTQSCVKMMRGLLEKACAFLMAGEPADLELIRRFSGIYVEDCTSIKLMEAWSEEFPGCGGAEVGQGAAGLKALLRIEATTGRISVLTWARGREHDLNLSREAGDVPAGSLSLMDLGFWSPERLDHYTKQGVFWISRVPTGATLSAGGRPRESLVTFLRRQTTDRVDQWVLLGEKKFAFRLVAQRCPKSVAERKKRKLIKKSKKRGRKPSQKQLLLCEWLVLVTNLCPEKFTVEELWTLYRVRWQIELVFKRWKSEMGLGHSRARTNHYRQLTELYAKLLGCLVTHWGSLLRAGLLTKLSLHRILKRVKHAMGSLKEKWDESNPESVISVLQNLAERLNALPPREKRKKKPGTMELLENPALAFN